MDLLIAASTTSCLLEDLRLLGHSFNIIIVHLVVEDPLIVGACDKVLQVVCTLHS